ncbi:hypothetical protein T4A_12463 [Trichinella pseudospiralis]|uniref:Uncharacterized protein n=1 Tax=Trichinella pseudospiralis TaxID=6337 RepID=A0A0V1EPH1_TRIPS|nr:hypothetical protein T4A_12463 [Trichinella pseudospiralis]
MNNTRMTKLRKIQQGPSDRVENADVRELFENEKRNNKKIIIQFSQIYQYHPRIVEVVRKLVTLVENLFSLKV